MSGPREPDQLGLNVSGLSPVERTALRELIGGLTFFPPAKRLLELKPYLWAAGGKEATATVETERERRNQEEELDANLFALGFGEMWSYQTLVAMRERSGGDAVMCAYDETDLMVTPVQVKGIRDPEISKKTLNDEIAKLGPRYPTGHDLVVVIAIHAALPYPLKDLTVPHLNLRELYIMLAAAPDLTRWQLTGDWLSKRSKIGFTEFGYPN